MSSLSLDNLEDACVGLLGNPWQRLLAFSSTNEEFSDQVFGWRTEVIIWYTTMNYPIP